MDLGVLGFRVEGGLGGISFPSASYCMQVQGLGFGVWGLGFRA